MALSKEEAQLIAVYRAIAEFDNETILSKEEVGELYAALKHVIDLDEKTQELNNAEVKILLYGFVAGVAAARVPAFLEQARNLYSGPDPDEEETYFKGGPTGGVAEGQGQDPRYVTQSGVTAETGS